MIQALLALSLGAEAASLPGVALPFEVAPTGAWVLPSELPAAFASAGVQAGWTLTAVDGLKIAGDPLAAQRIVAAGPARSVRLHFDTPEGETILVVPRGPLVVVEEVGRLPWPEGLEGAAGWTAAGDGRPRLQGTGSGKDKGQPWVFDPATGAITRAAASAAKGQELRIPEVWWSLSDAPWAVLTAATVEGGDRAWVRAELNGAARLSRFQGQAGDHLAIPEADGLHVYTVTWPAGAPELPVCVPEVPETCLVAGRQIAAQLLDKEGGKDEALRVFGLACEGGTYRACLEAVALDVPALAARANACGERDVNACHEVARDRMRTAADRPSDTLVGVLEYSCTVDASGSLGERLRRLEDVGEGCMLLSSAFDKLNIPDRALLSLDQACVLGRAEACDSAARRRQEAFALKAVRECEDETLPLATSCVQLGKLLQSGPISATKLDDFSAFLRACQLGDEEGCVRLGDYVDRWGIAHPRVVKAEAALQASCDQGEQRACVGTAHLLVRHEPRDLAYGQALTLFSTACSSGLPSACIAGAEQRRIGAARKIEAPSPEEMWDRACELGSPVGCAGLGERWSRSKKSWAEAYSAWTKACDTGEASACTALGRFVTNKHDPPWPSEQPPAAYLARGCEHGDAEGCYWQAEADLPRKGDPPEAAYLLLERSCEGDFGTACAALADVHLQRETSFDDEIAAAHLQSACDNGHFESCKQLGAMYQKGKGVEKDRTKAKELAQRYSVNADRRHVRLGLHLGFPSIAGGEGELVVPIPVGPAIALTGSYSYIPGAGGVMVQIEGGSYPDDPPDFTYMDAGLRLYPNNKARGLYGMAGVHQLQASGGQLSSPLTRTGLSARLGMYSESKFFYTRVEMGMGQYGIIDLHDFDEDETSTFPLLQATLAFSCGFAFF